MGKAVTVQKDEVIKVDKEQVMNSPQRRGRRVLFGAESIGDKVYSLQAVNETGTEKFPSQTMLGSRGR